MTLERDQLRAHAHSFLEEAWIRLEAEHIVPRPNHQPFIEVGKDYFGLNVACSEEGVLEDSLVEAFPERLISSKSGSSPLDLANRSVEFANQYVFSLLEWAVSYSVRMTRRDAFDKAIDELISFLSSPENETRICRIVSHINVSESIDIEATGIEIRPIENLGWVNTVDETKLPGLEGQNFFHFSQVPHALFVAKGVHTPTFEWSENLLSISTQIDRTILLLRLFRRTSARNIVQWAGFSQPAAFVRPLQYTWIYDSIAATALSEAERVASIDVDNVDILAEFAELLDEADRQAERISEKHEFDSTSWSSALRAFDSSFNFEGWAEQVPRLIRSIEGALLPEDSRDSIIHRLRQRLCLLLQVDKDSCERLYDEVGIFYGLRSSVEHAANLKKTRLWSQIRKLAGSNHTQDGVNEWLAIEKLRDLARRSIVLRLVLANANSPDLTWPIDSTENIDIKLLEDGNREKLRQELDSVDHKLGLGLRLPNP